MRPLTIALVTLGLVSFAGNRAAGRTASSVLPDVIDDRHNGLKATGRADAATLQQLKVTM